MENVRNMFLRREFCSDSLGIQNAFLKKNDSLKIWLKITDIE